MVHRNVEEALNLGRVQVHYQGAIGPSGGEQVGNQLGGDGNTGLVFAVLAGISKVRNHGGDASRRGALEGVNHQQELEQMLVHRIAGGLHQENIGAAHVFHNLHVDFAVRKAGDVGLPARHVEEGADLIGKRNIGGAGEDLELIVPARALRFAFGPGLRNLLFRFFRRCRYCSCHGFTHWLCAQSTARGCELRFLLC